MAEEIRLRALEPEDLDTLYIIENDEALWDEGPANAPFSHYILRQYIAESSCDIYKDGQVRLVATLPDGTPIGLADLTNFDPKHRRAEMGLVVIKPWRGRGYGRTITRKLAEYARKTLHLHQIYCIVSEQNKASLAMLRGEGFERQAVLKGWLCNGENYENAVLMQLFL